MGSFYLTPIAIRGMQYFVLDDFLLVTNIKLLFEKAFCFFIIKSNFGEEKYYQVCKIKRIKTRVNFI